MVPKAVPAAALALLLAVLPVPGVTDGAPADAPDAALSDATGPGAAAPVPGLAAPGDATIDGAAHVEAALGADAVPALAGGALGLGGLAFEPNHGQAPDATRFVARGASYEVHLQDDRIVVATAETPITIAFPRAAAADLRPEAPLPSRANFFLGADPQGWATDVPQYGAVRYVGLHPGADLLVHSQDGRLRFDHILAPGADPDQVRLRIEGADAAVVDGTLRATTAAGAFELAPPSLYQEDAARRRTPVEGGFVLHGDGTVGYRVGAYDARRPLVIDPTLRYASYYGTSTIEFVTGLAVHTPGPGTQRDITFTGWVTGLAYPTVVPAANQYTFQGLQAPTGDNIYVAKVRYDYATQATTPLWFTLIGDAGNDHPLALALTAAGEPVVTGFTFSHRFPTRNPVFDTTDNRGTYDGSVDSPDTWEETVVVKLHRDGNALLFSSYFGGGGQHWGNGVAVDGAGNIVLVGQAAWNYGFTAQQPMPIKAAFQPQHGNFAATTLLLDGFVAKLNPNTMPATIVFSTYLGGTGSDIANGVAVDATNDIYVAGQTTIAATFPTSPGAFQTTGGGTHAFAAKYQPTGARTYSTLLGGSSTDTAKAVAAGAGGVAWVVGTTISSDFPVCGSGAGAPCGATPVQGTQAGGNDAFLVGVNPTGTGLTYATYLGGRVPSIGSTGTTSFDEGSAVAYDPAAGHVTVAGRTQSIDFPVNGLQPAPYPAKMSAGTGYDAYLARIVPGSAAPLLYSTYFGGAAEQWGTAVAVDDRSNTYLGGHTANGFNLLNATQPSYAGSLQDSYLAAFAKTPPTARIQASAPGATTVTARPATVFTVPTWTDVTLTATNVPGDLPIGTVSWQLQDGGGVPIGAPVTGTTPSFSPLNLTLPDARNVCLTVADTDARLPPYNTQDQVCLRVEFANRAPAAAFAMAPDPALAGVPVAFTDLSTDLDGTVASWSWDFGDGGTAGAANPAHAFAAPGTYAVQLTVTDDAGATATVTRTLVVQQGPVALFGVGGALLAGLPVEFTDASTPGADPLAGWTWEFGDGASTTYAAPAPSGPVLHAYAAPGTYPVRLTVTDGTLSDEHVLDVTVAAPAPLPEADAFDTPEGTPLAVPAPGVLGNDVHPLGAAMAAILDAPPAVGVLALAPDGGFTYEPPAGFLGSVSFRYVVSAGNESAGPVDVTVLVRPFAAPTADFTAAAGTPLQVDFTDRSTPGDHAVVAWAWDFGDGTNSTQRSPGHAYVAGGNYAVTLTVIDAHGLSASRTRSVVVLSAPLLQGFGEGGIAYADVPGTATPPPAATAPADPPTPPAPSARPVNRAPVAVVAALGTARVGDAVLLDAAPSHDPDGDALQAAWRQTQGPAVALEGAATRVAAFTAGEAGAYGFELTLSDGLATVRRTLTVEIVSADAAPTAAFAVEATDDPAEVRLAARGPADARFIWDFGDGAAGEGAEAVHRYAQPGTYVVTLDVRTNTGTAQAVQAVAVRAPADPVAEPDTDATDATAADAAAAAPTGSLPWPAWAYLGVLAATLAAAAFRFARRR